MKKNISTIIMVTLSIMLCYSISYAQNSGYALIELLNFTPTSNVSDCTGEDLMSLLNGPDADLIESIECNNVEFKAGVGGAYLISSTNSADLPYIQFNFKKNPILQANRILIYGYDKNYPTEMKLEVNGKVVNTNLLSFPIQSNDPVYTHNAEDIAKGFNNNAVGGRLAPNINASLDNVLIDNCRISIKETYSGHEVPIYAVRINYDDKIENPSTSVEETINIDEYPVKYYDLQGRELRSIPQKGIYLRQSNGKTTKHIAY
ncbi:MAG: hypothetical protein K2K97_08580 [Muribaculaceae bacterium]|nr:hypothetical protein [Muribaculaceae bacterium]